MTNYQSELISVLEYAEAALADYRHHLKLEALAALHEYESGQVVLTKEALSAIRRALEELPND